MTGDGTVIFSRVLGEKEARREGFRGMRLYDQHLYTFRVQWTEQRRYRPFDTLRIYDTRTGSLIEELVDFLPERNGIEVTYSDTCLVMWLDSRVYDVRYAIQNRLPVFQRHLKVSFDGQELDAVSNKYGLAQERYPSQLEASNQAMYGGHYDFVGPIGEYLLFEEWVQDTELGEWHSFWLENDQSVIHAKYRVTQDLLGEDIVMPGRDGNPDDDWLLRNDCLYYTSGLTNGRVVVTRIPLSLLFPEIDLN